MIVCNINVGRDGNEWVAVLTYHPTEKTVEFRDVVFEEVMFAIAKELEGFE